MSTERLAEIRARVDAFSPNDATWQLAGNAVDLADDARFLLDLVDRLTVLLGVREVPNPYDETQRPFVGGGEFNYMYIDKVTGKPKWASAAEEQVLKDEYKQKFGEYAHDELRRTHIRTNDTPATAESETAETTETTEGAEGI